jgi:hypothetical protein
MSTYEQQRNENVRDNKQFLANLGLLNVGVLYRVQNNSHVNIFIHLFVLPHLISVLAQFFDSQQEMEEPKKPTLPVRLPLCEKDAWLQSLAQTPRQL